MAHARAAIATVLSILLGVLSCARPAGAGELSMTLLPTVAQRVESENPAGSFAGQALVIAADDASNPTKLVYLRFSLDTLPVGARNISGTLRVFMLKANKSLQLVRVFPVTFGAGLSASPQPSLSWASRPSPPGPQAIASAEVRQGSVNFELKGDKVGWLNRERGEIALMLRSASPNTLFTYQGLCPPADSAKCASTQPRLVVSYDKPLVTPAMQWPQTRSDAQHSGRTPWKLSARDLAAGVALRRLYTPHGNIVWSPVLAQRSVILYNELDDRGSDKFFVTARDEGGTSRWDVNLKAAATSSPLYDGRGRVWIVSANALHRIEAGSAEPSQVPHDLATLLGVASVTVTAEPTLGPSGAMYLSTDRGVFALTPYPDLRVFWRYGHEPETFGQVALGADEATAYVVRGAKQSTLIAIDNTDGGERWSRGGIDTPGVSPVPVPVIGTTRDDKGKMRTLVYVVSGYHRGSALHMFDGDTGRTEVRPAESYSRPVVAGTGRAFAVLKEKAWPRGKLCRFFWQSGWDEKKAVFLRLCQPDGPEDLSTDSVLAIDGLDNVYLIDPITNPQNPKQKVRGYTYDFAPLFALDVPPTGSAGAGPSTNFDRNLLIGPGGTLLLANSNALFGIEPSKLRDSAPASLTLGASAIQGADATAFLAKRITVAGDVTIAAPQSVVLRAGDIRFRPGFRVQRGAELQCDARSPSP